VHFEIAEELKCWLDQVLLLYEEGRMGAQMCTILGSSHQYILILGGFWDINAGETNKGIVLTEVHDSGLLDIFEVLAAAVVLVVVLVRLLAHQFPI